MDANNQSQKSVNHFNHHGLIDKVRCSVYSVYELLTAKNKDDTNELELPCPNENDIINVQTNEPEDSPDVIEAASDDDDVQLENQNVVESLDEPESHTKRDIKFTVLLLAGLFIIAAMASMVVAYAKLWLDGNYKTIFPVYPPVEKITVYEPQWYTMAYDALWEEIISKFLCFVDWIQFSSDPIPPPELSVYETIQESFLDTMKYCGIEYFLPPEEPPTLYDEMLNYFNQIAGRVWFA